MLRNGPCICLSLQWRILSGTLQRYSDRRAIVSGPFKEASEARPFQGHSLCLSYSSAFHSLAAPDTELSLSHQTICFQYFRVCVRLIAIIEAFNTKLQDLCY